MEAWLRDGLVVPAVDAARDGEGEAEGGADEGVLAVAPGLEEADAHGGVFAEPAGHDTAGGASADDHVVEFLHCGHPVGSWLEGCHAPA